MIAPLLGPQARLLTGGWGWYQVIAGLTAIVCCGRLFRTPGALLHRVLAATALFYIGGLTILFPMVDRFKSYGSAFRDMAACVAADPSIHVAGWRFDETTRAGFYYYCDLVFPPLSDINDLNQVLERRHFRFDGILALSRNFPPKSESLPPWRVREEVRMGPHRALQLIEGARQTTDGRRQTTDDGK